VQCYIFAFYFTKEEALKSILNNLSAIIFDLGGVVLNLQPQLTVNAFSKHAGLSSTEVYARFLSNDCFFAFEKGEIDATTFRIEVRKILQTNISDEQIDESWNAMLLDLPLPRLHMLAALRDNYQTFILSNTNAIHINAFNKIVAETTNGNKIDQFFGKVFYSHNIGMRKPDAEIYDYVIEANNLMPEQTLFIDDMLPNILGAQSVGLKTLHLTNQDDLTEIFSK